jgi:hypothetical protein
MADLGLLTRELEIRANGHEKPAAIKANSDSSCASWDVGAYLIAGAAAGTCVDSE